LVLLLVAATVVSFSIGDRIEAAAIAAVLILNAALGFWQEAAAERAILALTRAFTPIATVVRDGTEVTVDAGEVVPGDVLLVAEGDRVPADGRLLEEHGLEVDESALTGESLPVSKHASPVAPGTPLAERTSMIFAGTAVTRGRARALVTETGGGTELGHVASLAADAKPPPTPLERRLGRLARQMVVLGVGVTVALAGVMALRGAPWHEAFLVGVAVAVAAVPEGLAATVTAALALGARAMTRRGAIVRRLSAIETLGGTTVICTDKTGTLTENRIRVAGLRPANGVDERELLGAAILASSARTTEPEASGDPIEVALLHAGAERDLPLDLDAALRLVHEIPFDSDRKRMTRVYEGANGRRAFMKGAPEIVMSLASPADELLEAVGAWAGEGLRVLAVAGRDVGAEPLDEAIETGLELLGIVAFHDPLRPSALAAVDEARGAGISVRMLTGDHPATAHTIGRSLGLGDEAIIARATPAAKLELVRSLQSVGEVVAVTGDGVNDSPALRQSDAGVAMGRGGTEAAREAADVVLTDDDFATLVVAIREGRRIGDNIRKFVAFLLSANLGEVVVFAAAVGAGLGAPLAVIQVLVVNLVTDGLPALALARDPEDAATMASSPRVGGRLFDRRMWVMLGAVGLVVGTMTLASFLAGRAFGGGMAQTMAFMTLSLGELALVFGMRSWTMPAWRLPANPWLNVSVAGSFVLVLAAIYLPAAHTPLATTSLGLAPALVAFILALAPLALVEIAKLAYARNWRNR
jgi:calcium-translocating P-type ATPase